MNTGESSPVRPRVLVVDDSEDNRFLMQSLLEDLCEVQVAASGEDALACLDAEPLPDLVLLDILMPGLDGHAVMRRMRQDLRTADLPVIFLTALDSPEQEELGLDLGAADYITKPISAPILLARVRSQLERAAASRRLQHLSQQLGRYLSPQLYQSLFEGRATAEVRTRRRRLSIFFSDIKDFTAATASWEPEEVTFVLNSYFSEMSRIAYAHGGTIDKFVGDGMVVFFGDPHTRGVREDALQCVRMAIAMQQAMEPLHQRWRAAGVARELAVRMGIHTGVCDVGNFGGDLRMDYTIIGAEVNKAARLEQAAPAGGVLLSAETHALVAEEIEAVEQQPLVAKGFAQPLRAWSVRLATSGGSADATRELLQRLRLRVQPATDAAGLHAASHGLATGPLAGRLH
ncbi:MULTISPECIES: adenylate/guanylate cyclase domain-containing protein [Ramlibacter]|uniref:Response regulator n=1 Tax=Ramlibacter aquaticus TaxID=2780094 RepID=A0ABR9SEG1_9BURK|nr:MULTISPECIES: adenylate/guanylate cyclase domain-containing protein [Ramlibacter]MBE7940604.1 response regulator [Ramlibacter aquaticus]